MEQARKTSKKKKQWDNNTSDIFDMMIDDSKQG